MFQITSRQRRTADTEMVKLLTVKIRAARLATEDEDRAYCAKNLHQQVNYDQIHDLPPLNYRSMPLKKPLSLNRIPSTAQHSRFQKSYSHQPPPPIRIKSNLTTRETSQHAAQKTFGPRQRASSIYIPPKDNPHQEKQQDLAHLLPRTPLRL